MSFVGFLDAAASQWSVTSMHIVVGEELPAVTGLTVHEGSPWPSGHEVWTLRGVVSNERYVERAERTVLQARQPPLGRPGATAAALIPIRKSPAWWELTQDERRTIFEDRSHHIGTGVEFLPAVARRLHHSRDLAEPFDFLTWFEFAPADIGAFDELAGRLRATEEWSFVDREVDIRLER